MTPVPSGGFVDGLPEAVPVNRDLPVAYEGTYRDGGDGSDMDPKSPTDHVERSAEGGEVDAFVGVDGAGNDVTEVVVRRDEVYGVALLDSVTTEGRVELIGPRGFFFGESGGNQILKFGEVRQDKGSDVVARALTRQIAPGGVDSEALFRNVYVPISFNTSFSADVTVYIDGRKVPAETRTVTGFASTEDSERFEIPLVEDWEAHGRQGLRGTYLQVLIEVTDRLGSGYIHLERPEVEFEVVRESHPMSYTPGPLGAADLPAARLFYFGTGDGRIGRFGEVADDLGTAIPLLAQPNPVAPGGAGGEALFRDLYLAVTRNNATDTSLEVTPIVDEEELATVTVDLPAVNGPTTDIHEIPLTQPHESQSQQGVRGTWFEFRVESVGSLPSGDMMFDGAALRVEVIRESEEAVSA